MVLIRVTKKGRLVRKCDARCYDAKKKHCNCICGGANHGVGKKKAIENTRSMADDLLEDDKKKFLFLDDGIRQLRFTWRLEQEE